MNVPDDGLYQMQRRLEHKYYHGSWGFGDCSPAFMVDTTLRFIISQNKRINKMGWSYPSGVAGPERGWPAEGGWI